MKGLTVANGSQQQGDSCSDQRTRVDQIGQEHDHCKTGVQMDQPVRTCFFHQGTCTYIRYMTALNQQFSKYVIKLSLEERLIPQRPLFVHVYYQSYNFGLVGQHYECMVCKHWYFDPQHRQITLIHSGISTNTRIKAITLNTSSVRSDRKNGKG